MNRRTYLTALTAGATAGCLDRIGVASKPSEGSPDGGAPSDGRRDVILERVGDAGDAYDLTIDAELVESRVTPDHPAKVEITTTNQGRERDVSIADGMCGLFNRSRGKSDPAGLWIHRSGTVDHIEHPEGRWTRDRPADENRGYPAYGCLSKTFSSDESLTNAYQVWDDYRAEGYYSLDTYRFEERVVVSEPDSDQQENDSTVAEFTWGFSLRVSGE